MVRRGSPIRSRAPWIIAAIASVTVVVGNGAAALGAPDRPAQDARPGVRVAAEAAGRCQATGWSAVSLPDADRSIAMDVSALDGRAAWVVGMRAGRGIPRRPWAVRRTAGGWRSVPTPNVGADAGLVAVDAHSRGEAWAVGFRTVSRFLRPVAMRWTGARWTAASPRWHGGGSATLTDVTTGRGVWAVGYRTSGSGPKPYAVVRGASGWVRRDPDIGSARFGALTSVLSSGERGTWAAGWQSDRTAIRPLLVRWTGSRWERQTLPGGFAEETVLTGLTTSAGALWALGYRISDASMVPVLFRRGAEGWDRVDAATGSASMVPDDLLLAGGSPLLVGAARDGFGGNLVNAVARVAGGSLTVTPRPTGIKGSSHLRAAVMDGGRPFAVGWTDGRAIAMRRCSGSAGAAARSAGRGTVRIAAARSSGIPRRVDVRERPRDRRDSPSPIEAAARALETASEPAVAGVRFRDVAGRVGLRMVTPTYGGVAADLNGDGWDDLVISRHQSPARVLLNRRGRFRPAPSDPLRIVDRHGCAGGDIDGDAAEEIHCAVGASRGVKFKANDLLLSPLDRQPRNAAWQHGVADPFGRGRRVAFVQVDDDRALELLVTNEVLRVDGFPAVNRLHQNGDGAGLRPASDLGLDLPIAGTCALSAELDGRDVPEVVVCTEEAWLGRPGLHAFRRRNGRYVEATRSLGLVPSNDVDAVAADFDGDGRTDLAQLTASRLVISLQRGGRLQRVLAMGVQQGQALAAGDVNGDRRADLYVLQGRTSNVPDRMLVNAGSGRRFRSARIPSTRSGLADDVVTIDHDRNGRADFLVLNGHERAGSVQLIAAFPRR